MATSSVTCCRRSSPDVAHVVDQLVDGGAFVLLYLVELLRELDHAAVGVTLGEHLGAAPSELVEQVAQSGDLVAVGCTEA